MLTEAEWGHTAHSTKGDARFPWREKRGLLSFSRAMSGKRFPKTEQTNRTNGPKPIAAFVASGTDVLHVGKADRALLNDTLFLRRNPTLSPTHKLDSAVYLIRLYRPKAVNIANSRGSEAGSGTALIGARETLPELTYLVGCIEQETENTHVPSTELDVFKSNSSVISRSAFLRLLGATDSRKFKAPADNPSEVMRAILCPPTNPSVR